MRLRKWLMGVAPVAVLLAVLAFMGADGASPDAAASAVPPGTSCQGTGACVGSTFASIGENACNGEAACTNMVNATVGAGSCVGTWACKGVVGTFSVGASSCVGNQACVEATAPKDEPLNGTLSIAANSCVGDMACSWATKNGGTATVAKDSCLGYWACTQIAAYSGKMTIGENSCVSNLTDEESACSAAARTGDSTVGNNSCHGYYACDVAGGYLFLDGFPQGLAGKIGNDSCNGYEACKYFGYFGTGQVEDDSCNGAGACQDTGTFGGSSVIGTFSCNGAGACSEASSVEYGDPAPATSMIGDCSCNGDGQCAKHTGVIGDKAENLIDLCPNKDCTVVAGDVAVVYGDPVPQYSFTAFTEDGPFFDFVTDPVCTSAYVPGMPASASPLPITCSGATTDGGEVTYQAGTLTIQQASAYVVPETQSWQLGTSPSFRYRIEGFRNGDTEATALGFIAPTCGVVGGLPTLAGLYTVVCNGAKAANYTFINEGGVLTVTGSLPPTPPPATPTPAPAPIVSWKGYLQTYSESLGLRFDGECSGATAADAGATCYKETPTAAGVNACLYQVQANGTLSSGCITFEFRGSGQEWLLVSQTGSFTAAAEPTSTPVRPAPAPPNTGTGTGGGSAAWLLLFGALAMAGGGAAVWGKSRR